MKKVISTIEKEIVSLEKWEKNYVEGIEELQIQIKERKEVLIELREEITELQTFLGIASKIDLNSKNGKDAVAKGQMSLEDFRDIGSQSIDVNELYPFGMVEDVSLDGGKNDES